MTFSADDRGYEAWHPKPSIRIDVLTNRNEVTEDIDLYLQSVTLSLLNSFAYVAT